MAYSMDLRERVLALYDEGLATKQVAERLRVARSWARRIKQRRREGKGIAPKPVGGSKPKLDERARAQLARFVDERPDATLAELRARGWPRSWASRSASARCGTRWRPCGCR